jgi:hypothetical protein
MIENKRIQQLKNITMPFEENIHSDQDDEMSFDPSKTEKETFYVICLKTILPVLNWKKQDFGSLKCM